MKLTHQPLQEAVTVKQSQQSKNKLDAGQPEVRKNQLTLQGSSLSLADISDYDVFLSAMAVP